MTENEIRTINGKEIVLYREIETDLYRFSKDAVDMLLEAFEEVEQIKAIISDFPLDCGSPVEDIKEIYRQLRGFLQIGTIDDFKALKEKNDKDFELLLKEVKESYPIFKGAYVELDVFMGDVMRRFTRDRK